VYNASDYLPECLNSIQRQSLKEIEILVINDGSTDSSLDIIESFAKVDSRIHVINQKNSGPGASRNSGIRVAKGKYIGFVDADDLVEPAIFQRLYEAMEDSGSDFCVCNAKVIENGQENLRLKKLKEGTIDFISDRTRAIEDLMQFKYDYANWNKLYSRRIITDNSILFAEHITKGEDLLFNLIYFLHCNKGCVVDMALYKYIVRNSSLMQNNKFSVMKDFTNVARQFEYYVSENKSAELLQAFRYEMLRVCLYELLRFVHDISRSNQPFSEKKKLIKREFGVFKTLQYLNRITSRKLSFQQKLKLILLQTNFTSILIWIELFYSNREK